MKKFVTLLFLLFLTMPGAAQDKKLELATFAGGCFWCMEQPFDELEGVYKTIVGYTGGHKANPTYKEVTTGTTGHAEAIQVHYDPLIVSYEKLLDIFWRNIDPTALNGQFSDQGTQYRTAIFYHNEEQRRSAQASKDALEASGRYKGRPIVTEITPVSAFYEAEEYHQDYYIKSGLHYKMYRVGSGRDSYLKKVWGDEPKR